MVDISMHNVKEIKLGNIRDVGNGFTNVRTLTIIGEEGEINISLFNRESSDKLTIKQEI